MDRMERLFQSHANLVKDRANRKAIETERKLRLFIEDRKVNEHEFEGNREDSVLFTIIDSDAVCIWVQNIEPEDATICELSMNVLLNGILYHPEIETVTEYAAQIEESEVSRKNSDCTISFCTKYYFALHKAFLKNIQ